MRETKLPRYIVIGGGSAGCVVAARLSEDKASSVVLLEEGPRDWNPYIHFPVTYYRTSRGRLLNRYEWDSGAQKPGAPAPTMVQARVLGGGSSVNAMVYVRGVPEDYAQWEVNGAVGWGYQDVLPYFRRSEHNERFCNEEHGIDGPLGVSDQRFTHPLTKVWLQACQQAGIHCNPDFNSGNQEGCGLYQINTREGRRSSAAVAYLRPAEKRDNLSVRTNCRVLRILFENKKAVGVEYLHGRRRVTLRADAEIIVTAGAINSPKLLMLSGIGPAAHLAKHGIPIVHDLPGVGRNLQDHVEVSIINELNADFSYDRYKKLRWQIVAGLRYALFRDGPVSSNIVEGGAFWRSSVAQGRPDFQFCFMAGAGVEEGVATVPSGNGCTLNVCQTRPKSVGYVALQSADPLAAPYIRPNYLTEPHDVECMADGVEWGRRVMSQPVLKPYLKKEHLPEKPLRTRAAYIDFVKQHARAALHPVGTCRIGRDQMSVLGSDLSVHGVERLRVADASIMPNLISGNTNGATIMIAEKAADHIRHRP
jgi:choline dehydrogenase-like flavoprotein